MKKKTRKKRGGTNTPISNKEWVVKNTPANINDFVNDDDIPERGNGFNNMIQTMRDDEVVGGFWIIEWSEIRTPDDNYNHFHLAYNHEDSEGPDLIRFVHGDDGPDAPMGGKKKKRRKTKRRKKTKTKRRKRKTKRRKKTKTKRRRKK
jgi:hypothetical protein